MSDHPFVSLFDSAMDFLGTLVLVGLLVLLVFALLVVVLLRWMGVEYPAGPLFLGGSALSVVLFVTLSLLGRFGSRNRTAKAVVAYLMPIFGVSTAVAGFSGLAWIVLRILP